jgi:outer membrane protein OmpA-like peptidoglycan-associated protein
MRATISIVVLVCGVLLSAGLNRGSSDLPEPLSDVSPLASASFSITSARGELTIRGTTVSAAHELALQQLAVDLFGEHELQTDFLPGVVPGPGWEAASNRLLYVVATMDSAEAVMNTESVAIRGVTADATTFAARIEFLRERLPQQVELVSDVVYIRSRSSFEALCRRAFSEVVFGSVSFMESSAEIRQASLVTLDRITDYAHDCQNATIAITGHTDSSGDEAWNQQLSLARAQAVADHIAASGIDSARLVVEGMGSSIPVADNSTVQGRELNRRIEFELR